MVNVFNHLFNTKYVLIIQEVKATKGFRYYLETNTYTLNHLKTLNSRSVTTLHSYDHQSTARATREITEVNSLHEARRDDVNCAPL